MKIVKMASSGNFRYVWQHLEVGYVQGMCDIVAPLLVILDDGEGLMSNIYI